MVDCTDLQGVEHTEQFLSSSSSLSCFLPSTLHSNVFELSCSFSQAQISVEQLDERNRKRNEGSWKIGKGNRTLRWRQSFALSLFLRLIILLSKKRKLLAKLRALRQICISNKFKLSATRFKWQCDMSTLFAYVNMYIDLVLPILRRHRLKKQQQSLQGCKHMI